MEPEILIVSNRRDFACDYVVSGLLERKVQYVRLNLDDLSEFNITYRPVIPLIEGASTGLSFSISPYRLRAIYFRAPVFLREFARAESAAVQLGRTQWAAFARSLMVFSDCLWVNHPAATYAAECKPLQLALAKQLGFNVPETIIANHAKWEMGLLAGQRGAVIAKSLDTILLNVGTRKAFVYTNIVNVQEVYQAPLSLAPVVFQELLEPKIDVRVTVVGEKVFSVAILENGKGVTGDWRTRKAEVEYIPIEVPKEIASRCVALVRALRLNFGAIDLVEAQGKYYFIEINPTGEWGWLVERAKQPIDEAIADLLVTGVSKC